MDWTNSMAVFGFPQQDGDVDDDENEDFYDDGDEQVEQQEEEDGEIEEATLPGVRQFFRYENPLYTLYDKQGTDFELITPGIHRTTEAIHSNDTAGSIRRRKGRKSAPCGGIASETSRTAPEHPDED
jgi:hypothetical protein